MKRRCSITALAGLLLATSTLCASDWPRFLGPTADNISTETNLLDGWPASGPAMLWQKEIGTGYGAPSVRGGTLVLHHRVKDEEIVEAMSADDGRSRWRQAYPSQFEDPYGYNNGPRCTPLLTSNRCYTFGADGRLLCLELATGKIIWQRDTRKDWRVPTAFFGVGSTPWLEGDKLIVMVGGMPNAGVVALDAATGKTLWESVGEKTWSGRPKTGWNEEPPIQWEEEDHQASYSSPVGVTVQGHRQILCFMRQGLVSLNPENGALNFSYWFRSRVSESVNAIRPVVSENEILISSAYYRVGSALLKVQADGKTVALGWRGLNLEAHWNTPILHNGYLYAFSGRNEGDARFRCLEFTTGKMMWDRNERWQRSGRQAPQVYGRGSAILADGKLIVLGEGGLLGLFRVNPNKDEELARWQVPQLHHPCWAAPVLADKRLYLRSEDRLVCLDFARRQKP